MWFGLRSYSTQDEQAREVIQYQSGECIQDFCKECSRDGVDAFALLVVSMVVSVVEAICSILTYASSAISVHIFHFGLSLTAGIFSLVALNLFMGECYDAIDESPGIKLKWGTGGILAMVGMWMSWIVVAMHV